MTKSDDYILSNAKDGDFITIHATHPAGPGIYYCMVEPDAVFKEPVVLWGVLSNGSPVPITMTGPYGGTGGRMKDFVLFPNGHCSGLDVAWEDEKSAVASIRAELRKYDTSD